MASPMLFERYENANNIFKECDRGDCGRWIREFRFSAKCGGWQSGRRYGAGQFCRFRENVSTQSGITAGVSNRVAQSGDAEW